MSKEMNNDNDLNVHSMTKLSGWLRYCLQLIARPLSKFIYLSKIAIFEQNPNENSNFNV